MIRVLSESRTFSSWYGAHRNDLCVESQIRHHHVSIQPKWCIDGKRSCFYLQSDSDLPTMIWRCRRTSEMSTLILNKYTQHTLQSASHCIVSGDILSLRIDPFTNDNPKRNSRISIHSKDRKKWIHFHIHSQFTSFLSFLPSSPSVLSGTSHPSSSGTLLPIPPFLRHGISVPGIDWTSVPVQVSPALPPSYRILVPFAWDYKSTSFLLQTPSCRCWGRYWRYKSSSRSKTVGTRHRSESQTADPSHIYTIGTALKLHTNRTKLIMWNGEHSKCRSYGQIREEINGEHSGYR